MDTIHWVPNTYCSLIVKIGDQVIYDDEVIYEDSPVKNLLRFENALERILILIENSSIPDVAITDLRKSYDDICLQRAVYEVTMLDGETEQLDEGTKKPNGKYEGVVLEKNAPSYHDTPLIYPCCDHFESIRNRLMLWQEMFDSSLYIRYHPDEF